MGFKKTTRLVMNHFLKPLGLRIERSSLVDLSMEATLSRAAIRFGKNSVRTVVDIGASDGSWSEACERAFPNANYLLIEAQKEHEPKLAAYCRSRKMTDFVICAAGDQEGEIYFDASDLYGGLASTKPFQDNSRKVPMHSLDYLVKSKNLPGPYLIKFDTHGFEVPILAGATECLKNTDLILMETYNFDIAQNSLRFYQMCQLLEEKGFRCIDLSGPLLRPIDQSFWQIDFLFARSESIPFKINSYSQLQAS
ncbi:MAG: FkbM family methyltransferase [Deltaproteobacteria bacterium]|nr:FkbM family methyltransferase [Deltaproteobacteria bacterium]